MFFTKCLSCKLVWIIYVENWFTRLWICSTHKLMNSFCQRKTRQKDGGKNVRNCRLGELVFTAYWLCNKRYMYSYLQRCSGRFESSIVRQISGKIMFLKKSLARYSYPPPNMVGWVFTCNILNSFPTPLKIIVRGINTF